MPALTKEARYSALQRQLDPSQRFIDFAVQFRVFARGADGGAIPTDKLSKIYGGVLDRWSGRYTGARPENPAIIPCSENQLVFLEDQSPFILAVGARGGGKSEASKTKALAYMAMLPATNGQLVAPTYRHAKVLWGKILADLPHHWVADVRVSDKEIHLINGVIVRFVSADDPETLRGWGGAWSILDEAQGIADAAVDIAWLSHRETTRPQLCQVGTAKAGMFRDRYERMEADPNSSLHHFPAAGNPFIPQTVYEIAKGSMDPRLYRQEVLAEWTAEADRVYEFFDVRVHAKTWKQRMPVLRELYGRYEGIGEDITERVTKRRFGVAVKHLGGVDFNISPMVAVIYRILRAPPGVQDIMWAVEEVILDERADAQRLAREIKKRGYASIAIVADTSDSRAKSYYRQIKAEKLRVFRPASNRRNPAIKDRVNAVSAKMLNADNEITFFIDPKLAPRTVQALVRQTRDDKGMPRKGTYDHFADAAGYPIIKLYPAAAGLDKIKAIYAR